MQRYTGTSCLAILILLAIYSSGASLARAADPVMVYAGPVHDKAVALTFDDGPSAVYTPQVLALLKRYGAHATFFVIGHKVEKTPYLVKAELAAGNEVGNHTFTHPHLPAETQAARERELERTSLDLDLVGCPTQGRLFRPPYSQTDDRLKSYMAHTGRHLVMWSLDSGDWRGLPAPAIIKNVLGRVKNGAIIIFHDSDEYARANRHPTVEALQTILPALKAQGYSMVTVSKLLQLGKSPALARTSAP